MGSRDEEFDRAVSDGLEAKRIKQEARTAFDDGWLKFKEELRKTFVSARDVLDKHKIQARVSDPNGNVYLEAVFLSSGLFVHKLSCDKDKDTLKIVITSSLHSDVRESFGLDVAREEVDCRVKKFLREVAEAETPSPRTSSFFAS